MWNYLLFTNFFEIKEETEKETKCIGQRALYLLIIVTVITS